MDDKHSHRKVYAKGYYDGLRDCGIDPNKKDGSMNQGRLKSVINGLTGVSRRVYEAVPIAGPWTAAQIGTELFRTSHRIDPKTIEGCLASLTSQKLIAEPQRGLFCKFSLKETPAEKVTATPAVVQHEEVKMAAIQKADTEKSSEKSPIDILAEFGDRIKTAAVGLQKIASDIDAAAIAIEEQLEESEGKSVKLKQLQMLLKDLA